MVNLDYLVVNDLDEVGFVLLDFLEHSDEVVFFVVDKHLLGHCALMTTVLIVVG